MRQMESVRQSPKFDAVLAEAAEIVRERGGGAFPALEGMGRVGGAGAAALEAAVETVARAEPPAPGLEIPTFALEAIVLDKLRPPYLIIEDEIVLHGDFDRADLVTANIALFNDRARNVGRVDLLHHLTHDFVGTGWLIDRNIVVTNRHVAQTFAQPDAWGRQQFMRGRDDQQVEAIIDFIRQHQTSRRRRAWVTEILYVASAREPDFAFLRIEPNPDVQPLPLASRPAEVDQVVAAIGYPARDLRNDAALMDSIFQGRYNVKRFSPGLVTRLDREADAILTDYTTLGGNSGSAVIALDSGDVVGLHFAGAFRQANYAVPADLVAAALRALGPKIAIGASPSAIEPPAPEAVWTDAADFHGREGYDPGFLGDGLQVPLPEPGRWRDDIAEVEGAEDGVLRYEHFSVVQCRSRRLPLFTAVNIDGERQRVLKRRGEWRLDGRLRAEDQIGAELYARNALDRGHMVRRRDPGWGSRDEAERGESDTFHYTNSAPQHEGLNQHAWLGLEDYILGAAETKGFRACVFTGPVFRDSDRRLKSQPGAEDIRIPEEFWKIAVMVDADSGDLHATGYVLSHGPMIRDMTEAAFVFGRYETHQVPIRAIEQATGLDFHELADFDPMQEESAVRARIVRGPDDIQFSTRKARQTPSIRRNDMDEQFRIVAHFMHEAERDAALGISPGLEATDAFLTGSADSGQIEAMRNANLIVEVIGPIDPDGTVRRPGEPETPGRGIESPTGGSGLEHVSRRPLTFSTHPMRRGAGPQDDLPDLDRPLTYLVQIDGPLLETYREALEGLGVRLEQNFRNGFYTARLQLDQAEQVRSLPFVIDASRYDARETGAQTSAGLEALGEAAPQPGYARMLTYDIRLHRAEDSGAVLAWLKENHVPVAGMSGHKIRIYALDNSDIPGEIAALDEVQRVEEHISPRLWNDRAGALLGTRTETGRLPFDGSGQVIGVADTGLDDRHTDFSGRIVTTVGLGRPGRTDDPHGHGTHVAGSALGDGAGSGGAFAGSAPAARLVFQSVLDAQGGLGGLPLDLGDLFAEAYSHGARIHNNSWGSSSFSTYTMSSEDVDAYVARQRDMLVVFAAGNEGQGSELRNAQQGFVEWLSIGAPATAKNALTVGASRGDRTSGGLSAHTYKDVWGNDFPHPPLSGETISGNPEEMAGFSSRGPSDDRRIKPDVVAPGTDILSCRSSRAPAGNFWGLDPAHPTYGYMGGTSMAAPLVAGCAALVRQYFEQRNHAPSAALLRATLINGTRWLAGQHSNATNPAGATPEGNFDQGFGRVDMAASLPHPGNPDLRLAFVDNWQSPGDQLGRTGDRRRWVVEVESGSRPLRICLAYTDLPARALQNNLNLFVQAPDGTKYMGNQQMRLGLKLPDSDNNVEIVRIATPAPGRYLIQVSAQNLLRARQDFAMVVTGHLKKDRLATV